MNTQEWCIHQHRQTNHIYDRYLPYDFHLKMASNVYEDFKNLMDDVVDYYTGKKELDRGRDVTVTLRSACSKAVWGHDLIEDCRVSYNDCKNVLGQEAADIIYAVSNEKGRNRKERANEKYYEGIRNTPGAVFVKLCDRIANVQYGKLTKSRMFEVYKKENDEFIAALGFEIDHPLKPMFDYLLNLLNDQ